MRHFGLLSRRGAGNPLRWARSPVVWGAFLAIVGLAVGVESRKETIWPKRWRTVAPGVLYRSGQLHPSLIERTLRNHGIRVIVDLTAREPGGTAQEAELDAARRLGIRHHRFELTGWGTGELDHHADALAVMRKAVAAGEPCLVHCAAGTERTGAAVAFYRILFEGVPPSVAVEEMKACGMRPHRNPHLLPYMRDALPRLPDLLARRGVPAMGTTSGMPVVPVLAGVPHP